MCIVFLVALLLATTSVDASPNQNDSVTSRLISGPLRDFDGDGLRDTLLLTQQRRERHGKTVSARAVPSHIVWGDTVARKKYDTTVIDVPKQTDCVIGVRVEDLTGDQIVDIELLYRWSDTSLSKNGKDIQEKIWLIAGGASLRDEKHVKLQDAKKPLTTTNQVLSERAAGTRDSVQSIGVGGYGIRRIQSSKTDKLVMHVDDASTASSSISLAVYPNPARDQIHVRVSTPSATEVGVIEILDLGGRIVIRQQAQPELNIDVRSLTSGTYSMRLRGCDECPPSVQFQIAR